MLLCCLCSSFAQTGPPKTSLADALSEARSPLVLTGSSLSGDGLPVLSTAISDSRFVLIGESHLTHEIPLFTSAICKIMHPDAYAVEVGPVSAAFVDGQLQTSNRIASLQSYLKRYPNSIAFQNMREENDTAADCATASHNSNFHLWGLDQEFLASAGALLDAMAATNPGARSQTAIASLRAKERTAEAEAATQNDYFKVYLLTSTDQDIAEITGAIQTDGTPETKRILHEFTESRRIYLLTLHRDPDSNRVRTVLLKQHFLAEYVPLSKSKPDARILFKFGANHVGKGFNPLHQRDLGNFVAETADAEQVRSLHIYIMGAKGIDVTVPGYRKPLGQKPFDLATDEASAWMKPALANLFPNAGLPGSETLTVFDLRKLRYRKLDLDESWKTMIYSYDLFVLVPQVTAGSSVE